MKFCKDSPDTLSIFTKYDEMLSAIRKGGD